MAESDPRSEIFESLNRLHAAQEATDVDAMLELFRDGPFAYRSQIRATLEAAIERGAFENRSVDLGMCETFVHRNAALVKPVIYQAPRGPRYRSFHLVRETDGIWRVMDSNRSQLPTDRFYTDEYVANAAKLVDSRGMLWVRRFEIPVERVWEAVSTKQGLDRWFLTRDVKIDLAPGGRFEHHWNNTVLGFEPHAFIEFGPTEDGSHGRNVFMRFELEPDGEGTVFSFFDSYNAVDSPFIVPWNASGWHCMVDGLEHALTGRQPSSDFGLGGEFYWRYLRRLHWFANRANQVGPPALLPEDWRAAYLTESL